jgi:hypothetical protein
MITIVRIAIYYWLLVGHEDFKKDRDCYLAIGQFTNSLIEEYFWIANHDDLLRLAYNGQRV